MQHSMQTSVLIPPQEKRLYFGSAGLSVCLSVSNSNDVMNGLQ